MLKRRLWLALLAGVLGAGGVHAAASRDSTTQDVKPPLQTGEVKTPTGGVDTSGFDPNAGSGVKGQSTPGGGVIQRREAAGGGRTGATTGAPATGATTPKGPRDTGGGASARGERGSGTSATDSGDTRSSGGAGSAGSRVR